VEQDGPGESAERVAGGTLDRAIVEQLRGWLRPGAWLVLAAPGGCWPTDAPQPADDADDLERLLEGWRVVDRRFAVFTEPHGWELAEGEPPASAGARGMVLLRATPAGP
jgi:hypothetical protein